MARLGTETAFEVLAKARALEAKGKNIVHMEIGEPDFDTPENIKSAAIEAIKNNETHYTPAPGTAKFRESVAAYLSRQHGVAVDSANIVGAAGAKPIIYYGITASVNPGEEVIYPNPGYPIYESVARFVRAVPVPLPMKEENEFRFDVEVLKEKITSKTKMLVLNSPANPTGGVLEKSDLKAVADLALDHDFFVLSDEPYCRIVYDGFRHHSILSLPGMMERTILVEGFSKTFAMTGWRAGFGYVPSILSEHISRLIINTTSCMPRFVQTACIEALEGPQDGVEKMVGEFKRRRDRIVEGLNAIPGFSCLKPKGAFYVFPNTRRTGVSSKQLADSLLAEGGVAALSGACFGSYGEGYLRFSYATSLANIDECLLRLEKYMAAHPVQNGEGQTKL